MELGCLQHFYNNKILGLVLLVQLISQAVGMCRLAETDSAVSLEILIQVVFYHGNGLAQQGHHPKARRLCYAMFVVPGSVAV